MLCPRTCGTWRTSPLGFPSAASASGQSRLGGEPARGPPLPGGRGEPGEVARLFQPGEELDLAEVHRLQRAGRGQLRAKGEEIVRRHGLETLDLLDQQPFDDMDAM